MKNSVLSLALALLSLAPVIAQHKHGADGHKHGSAHGGTIKSAGNYHLELLQKKGTLTVYLLDANEKTLPITGASATAILQTPDGKVTTANLIPSGTEQFIGTLDKTKLFHKAVVTVVIKGQSASASFDLMSAKKAGGHTGHKH